MKYLIISGLLVLFGLLEFLLIRKGLKTGSKPSSSLRNDEEPSLLRSLRNKYLHSPERRAEPFPKPKKGVEPVAERGEKVLSFPEKSPKLVDLAELKRAAPSPESPAREPSMRDIIQEIRGESSHSVPARPESPPAQLPAEVKPAAAPPALEPPPNARKQTLVSMKPLERTPRMIDLNRKREERNGQEASPPASELADDAAKVEELEDIEEIEATEKAGDVASPEELVKTGVDLVRRGHLDEGIRKIEAVIAQVPEKADAHFNLGIAYTLKENLPQAINAYQRAIEIEPKYGKAYYNLGTLYLKQGAIPDAIAQLEEAVKLLPDSMKALWNLYEAYRSSELFTKALSSLQKLSALEPEDASLHNHLAICYVKLGDYAKAINSWQRSISLGASSHLIHYNLGKTYELSGDVSAAREHYQQFLALAAKTAAWQELVAEVQDRLANLQPARR